MPTKSSLPQLIYCGFAFVKYSLFEKKKSATILSYGHETYLWLNVFESEGV